MQMTIHHPRKQKLTRFQLNRFQCGILIRNGENGFVVVFTRSDDDAVDDDDDPIADDFEIGEGFAVDESAVEYGDDWTFGRRGLVSDYHGVKVEMMLELEVLAGDINEFEVRPT